MSKEISQELLAQVSAHIQRSTQLAKDARGNHPLITHGHRPSDLFDSGREKITGFVGAGVIYVRTVGVAKQKELK